MKLIAVVLVVLVAIAPIFVASTCQAVVQPPSPPCPT
jgi:hypothetical protein